MTTAAPVTIYVPCYNAAVWLDRVIPCLLMQSLRPQEIFVIDDGSTDNSRDLIAKYPVTLIDHGINKGLSAARNTAFNTARTEWVGAIDSDVMVTETWLEDMLNKAQSDPTIAAVGGCLIEGETGSLADRWRAVHMRQNWGPEDMMDPPFLYGANTLMRRDAVLATGGFDPSMRTNGEDVLMSEMLVRDGHRLAYAAKARAVHLRTDSIESVLATYWRHLRYPLAAAAPAGDFTTLAERLDSWASKNILPQLRHDLDINEYDLAGLTLEALDYVGRQELRDFAARNPDYLANKGRAGR